MSYPAETAAPDRPAGPAPPVMPVAGGLTSGLRMVRLGALRTWPQVLRRFAVDVRQALAWTDLPADLFADPDRRISPEDLDRLLSVCVELTGCEHFGVLLGADFSLDHFAELGELLRNSSSVSEALHVLQMHLKVHDRLAAPVLLRPGPSTALLGYSLLQHGNQAAIQLQGAAIGIAYRLLRELCGPTWKPLQVQFAHARPRNPAAYRQVFGVRLRFDAEVSGILFAQSWLERPIQNADPALRTALARTLLQAGVDAPLSFTDQVECALHQLLLARHCSADSVAQLFGIHQRTLRLRLQKERTALQALLDQVRFELAQQMLLYTRLSLAEITSTLCYADPTVFSRAFHQWSRTTPRQWQIEHRERSP